jgi:hypothetical protein
MKIAAYTLLSIAIILTLWMIQADRDVPKYTSRWGEIPMGTTVGLIFLRWIVLSIAFILLLRFHSSGVWKTLLALTAIFALEIASYNLHRTSLTSDVKPHFKILFLTLATLLPLCVIAGGFLSSRALCMAGVIVAVAAGMVGSSGEKTFLAAQRPYFGYTAETPIASMLYWANPMSEQPQLQELWGHIEKHSDWAEQVASQLDGEKRMFALYALCHNPARITGDLQERCWAVAGEAARDMKKQREREPFTSVTVVQLLESVKALAALPGAVRDRHRADFLAARDVVKMAHAETPSIPVLDGADWTLPAN